MNTSFGILALLHPHRNFIHDSLLLIEKATDEKNMSENWETILDVCDKVKAITTGPKDCLRAIIKRLYHQNPHVAKQAVKVKLFFLIYF
jgi:hypothetical protein